ncbi:MAG: LacI family DNA-binding transcriptional regulator [Lachnospiraceae bacterium]
MASIKDVAARAGVSISTVSRYMNKSSYVDEAKAEAIQEAMEYFHYRPSQFGRGLATKKTDLIGVYLYMLDRNHGEVSVFDNSYYLELLKGIDLGLRGTKYGIVLLSEDPDYWKHPEQAPKYIEYFRERKIDGLILAGLSDRIMKASTFEEMTNAHFPLVYIGRKQHRTGMNVYAGFTQYHVEMVRCLYEAGHRKIWMSLSDMHAAYTAEILRQVKEQFPDLALHIAVGPYEAEPAQIEQALAEHYTAVCSSAMACTQSIYLYCAEHGIRIPEDLSVISVGSSPEEGKDLTPRPSFMCTYTKRMGKSAALMLAEAIDSGEMNTKSVEFQSELIEGASVAKRSV